MSVAGTSVELRDYLRILWRRKLQIALVAAVVLGAALFYTLRQPPRYSANAEVLVQPVNLPVPGAGFSTLNMLSERRIAASSDVTGTAIETLQRAGIDVVGVSIEAQPDEQILSFTATGSDAGAVQANAETYADSYLAYRSSQIEAVLSEAEESVKALIRSLRADVVATQEALAAAQRAGDTAGAAVLQIELRTLAAQVAAAQQQLNDLVLASGAPVGQVLTHAGLPTVPVGPDHLKTALIGLFVGMSLGVGLAFLLERLDDRVRGRDAIETYGGAPLLASIPDVRRLPGVVSIVDDPFSTLSESYRALRVRILYWLSQNAAKTLLVTSAAHEEGKTTTAVNVAVALAEVDKRVILASADLHRPGLDAFFAANGRHGLTSVLSDERALADAIQPTWNEHLFVVRTGSRATNPAELIGSPRMRGVIGEMEGLADVLILDGTPIGGTSDALTLAPLADAVIVVADARRLTRSTLSRTTTELRSVGATIMGIVLTHSHDRELGPYAYAYGRVAAPAMLTDGETPMPAPPSGERRSSTQAAGS